MKLFFLSSDCTSLAQPGDDLLSAIRSRALADEGFENAATLEEADACILYEEFSFKTWRYIERLRSDPIVGKMPHKVYTVNADDAANGLLKGLYTSLPRRRFDPKRHRTIPYHLSPNPLVSSANRNAEPTLLATFRGNPKSNPLRQILCEHFSGHPRIRVETTQSWMNHDGDEHQHYVDLLLNGKFSLCPAGWAPTSFRIFESMALRRVPVIISDEFVRPANLPWEEFAIFWPENKIDQLEARLLAAEPSAEAQGEKAHAVWLENFSPERVFHYYWQELKSLLLQPRPDESAESERRLWKSGQMTKGNNWTLAHRLKNFVQRKLKRGA